MVVIKDLLAIDLRNSTIKQLNLPTSTRFVDSIIQKRQILLKLQIAQLIHVFVNHSQMLQIFPVTRRLSKHTVEAK